MTPLLYLMACLMSPSPLIDLAESRVKRHIFNARNRSHRGIFTEHMEDFKTYRKWQLIHVDIVENILSNSKHFIAKMVGFL
jgi:hypothetical protein